MSSNGNGHQPHDPPVAVTPSIARGQRAAAVLWPPDAPLPLVLAQYDMTHDDDTYEYLHLSCLRRQDYSIGIGIEVARVHGAALLVDGMWQCDGDD